MPFTAALYAKLNANAALTALLGVYPAASADAAIFTADPVPEDADFPYVVLSGRVSDVPFDTKDKQYGRDILDDVRCYAERTGSIVAIDDIAEKVRTALHDQSVTVAGYDWIVSEVTGPIRADEEDVYGRILTVRLVFGGQ